MRSSINFIISILVGIVAFLLAGYIRTESLVIPGDSAGFLELLIIIAAVFAGCLLASRGDSEETMDARETGTVKWYNVKKGYGFITRDQGDDVFVHHHNIEGSRHAIFDGQRVSFIVISGEKGLQADEVTPEAARESRQ